MERTKAHRSSRRLHNCLWKIHGRSSERGSCLNRTTQPGLNLPTGGRLPPAGRVGSLASNLSALEKSLNWFRALLRWPPCDFRCEVSHCVKVGSCWCRVAADVGWILSRCLYAVQCLQCGYFRLDLIMHVAIKGRCKNGMWVYFRHYADSMYASSLVLTRQHYWHYICTVSFSSVCLICVFKNVL